MYQDILAGYHIIIFLFYTICSSLLLFAFSGMEWNGIPTNCGWLHHFVPVF